MAKLTLINCVLLIVIAYLCQSNAVKNPKVVCYYDYWAYWRQGKGKMTVQDIDSTLCTHIVYAFLGITDAHKLALLDPYLMEDLSDLKNFIKRKGNAKAMIAVGGSSQSSKYAQMAETQADRNTFVDSVVAFLDKYHFDGIMIDWAYPSSESDSQNYIKLLDRFDEKFAGTSYVMGTTGSGLKAAFEKGYNVPKIIDYLDFVHVLSYDYHGPWDSKTDYAAPIDEQVRSLELWVDAGAPKNKLLMSIPLFARTWKLADLSDNEKGATASGPGTAGPYTQTAGMLSYNELCTAMRSSPSDWVLRRDLKEPAIYAIHGHDFITFEDPKTIKEKVSKVTKEGYGGIAVYALSNDDFHGDCGGTKFPLLKAVNDGLDHS